MLKASFSWRFLLARLSAHRFQQFFPIFSTIAAKITKKFLTDDREQSQFKSTHIMSILHTSKHKQRIRSKGQALTEYSTLIAFVSVLVALAFSFTQGKIGPALSQAYHQTAIQLNNLSDAANNAS